jgi:hypothetical protein
MPMRRHAATPAAQPRADRAATAYAVPRTSSTAPQTAAATASPMPTVPALPTTNA